MCAMYNLVHVCPAYMCMYISVTLPHCHFNILVCLCSVKKDGWCLHSTHKFTCLNHSVLSATHNYAPPTGHTRFTLRQQPQASVQLRNDMLQKVGVV